MQSFLKDHAGWGVDTALACRLSRDLKINTRTLQQSLQFYRAYPQLNRELPIGWSHYRVLMTVESPSKRKAWERRIVREQIRTDHLRDLVYQSRQPKISNKTKKLPRPLRGMLYHYRMVKVDYVNEAPGGIMLDCGFANCIVPPSCKGTLINKRIVRADKDDEEYHLVLSQVTADRIFTFKALIERVVDGDTLLANIDCGFGLWTRQYLRLKWIDAPEQRNAGGLRSKRWLEKELARSSFVIVRTHKSDKYDRYLADIFYLPGNNDPDTVTARGRYLNQEILDHGMAKVWGE